MTEDDTGPGRFTDIDDNLKRVFQQTLNEDLPQRFKDLLADLKKSGPDAKGSDS